LQVVSNPNRPTAAGKRRTGTFVKVMRNDWQLYALMFLPLVYFLLFKYVPMAGVIVAFKEYNIFKGIWASEWIGLAAFEEVFRSDRFWIALRNTFMLNFLDLVVGFPVPIILALLLNEIRIKWFKRTAQTMLYLPHFISWVVISGMAIQLLATNAGSVNVFPEQARFRIHSVSQRSDPLGVHLPGSGHLAGSRVGNDSVPGGTDGHQQGSV